MKKKILIPAIALMLAITLICLAACTDFTIPGENEAQNKDETTEYVPSNATEEVDALGTLEIMPIANSGNVLLSAGQTVVKSLSYTEDSEKQTRLIQRLAKSSNESATNQFRAPSES